MEVFPEYIKKSVAELVPYARNSRTHSAAQINQIAASIKEFKFLNPVIIDGEGVIIAGHGRVMAAQKLGMTELPCIQANHLTEAQRRAYVIADNKLALNAEWNDELLRIELGDLSGLGFDLSLTGFNIDEINALSFDGALADVKHHDEVEDDDRDILLIECTDENELELLFDEMQSRGFQCKIMS